MEAYVFHTRHLGCCAAAFNVALAECRQLLLRDVVSFFIVMKSPNMFLLGLFFKSTLQSCCCGSDHSRHWDCRGVWLKDIMMELQDWMGVLGDWIHSVVETSLSRCGALSKEIRQPDANTALKVMDPEWITDAILLIVFYLILFYLDVVKFIFLSIFDHIWNSFEFAWQVSL